MKKIFTTTNSYKIIKYVRKNEKQINIEKNTLEQLIRVAQNSFGSSMSRNEVINHLIPNDVIFIAYKNDLAIGFAGNIYKNDNLYLSGAVLETIEQNKGLYKLLTTLRIEHGLEKNITSITTATQNPRVEKGIINVLNEFYSNNKINRYEVKRELLNSRYGRMLTEIRPYSLDQELNLIYSKLNYEKGDAFLITFTLK